MSSLVVTGIVGGVDPMFRLQNEGNHPREKWVGGSIMAYAVDLRETLLFLLMVWGVIDRLIDESLWKC